jgi:hypothetical protein
MYLAPRYASVGDVFTSHPQQSLCYVMMELCLKWELSLLKIGRDIITRADSLPLKQSAGCLNSILSNGTGLDSSRAVHSVGSHCLFD